MAHFLLFVFVFATQLFAGFSTQKLSPPVYGKKISILSIDGGGIKGIIPATVLDHLDKALKVNIKTTLLILDAHHTHASAHTDTYYCTL